MRRSATIVVGLAVVVLLSVGVWVWTRSTPTPPPELRQVADRELRPLDTGATNQDPTKLDQVLLPTNFVRGLTPEQERRVEEIRREMGELQSRRVIAEREAALARTQSLNLPTVRPAFEEYKAAQEEYDRLVRAHPAVVAQRQKAAELQRRLDELENRYQALRRHVEEHWASRKVQSECEWCQRDASRMELGDAALRSMYMREERELGRMIQETRSAWFKAATHSELPEQDRKVAEEKFARLRAAREALEQAWKTVPEVARWDEEAIEAYERQKALANEWREIMRQAPLVPTHVAGPGNASGRASDVP